MEFRTGVRHSCGCPVSGERKIRRVEEIELT